MTRCGLAAINGLVISAVIATTAFGQTSGNQRKSLSQRMADLRYGWNTSSEERAPAQKFPNPESEGGSLIPNWLSNGEGKQAGNANSQGQNQNAQGQNSSARQRLPSQQGQSARTYGQATSGQATQQNQSGRDSSTGQQSKSSKGVALPGLGGSPLPSTTQTAPQARAGSNAATRDRYAETPDSDPNYPVIRETTPKNQSQPSTTASTGTQRTNATPRKSPLTHSQTLRGEFSGSFSSRSQSDGPVARTAQANDRSAASGELAVDASDVATSESAGDSASDAFATPAAPIFTAPENDAEVEEGAYDAAVDEQPEPRNAAEAFGQPRSSRPSIGISDFIRTPRSHALPEAPSAARSKEAFGEALQIASGGDPSVLVSNQTPVISTDIRGPKQILVGREAVYRVRLQNQSAAKAEGIVATIRIPSSAEVVEATATQGTVDPSRGNGGPTQLEWHLSNLDARGSEVLDIRIIPRENKPLELGVSWTTAPVGSRAIVEVQEPQLKIEIGGPTEVLFDQPQVYRLTLSNPGTGPAANVKIDLVPPGGTRDTATSHTFGDLDPGNSKSIEIELTAREAGKLMMKAVATAEGGLSSDASKEIFCRKPELEVDWRGPASKYAGTPATYFFRVRNPGTAAAEDVTVAVALPEGAEFTSASEGQQFDAQNRQVKWRVGTLNPGDDSYMELKCVVQSPGANQFKVTASNAAGNLSDSKIAETNVEAIADLKLSVSDPSGPVAVGSEAVYDIRVQNRGSNTARNINVVGLFSEGIEPEQAEGSTYTVTDGRVSFRAIDEIPAGGDVKLRIRARALRAGTHVFRAEVLCSDLEIKLAAEETTRFYADDVMSEGEEAAESGTSQEGFESAEKKGGRYQ